MATTAASLARCLPECFARPEVNQWQISFRDGRNAEPGRGLIQFGDHQICSIQQGELVNGRQRVTGVSGGLKYRHLTMSSSGAGSQPVQLVDKSRALRPIVSISTSVSFGNAESRRPTQARAWHMKAGANDLGIGPRWSTGQRDSVQRDQFTRRRSRTPARGRSFRDRRGFPDASWTHERHHRFGCWPD